MTTQPTGASVQTSRGAALIDDLPLPASDALAPFQIQIGFEADVHPSASHTLSQTGTRNITIVWKALAVDSDSATSRRAEQAQTAAADILGFC